MTSMNKCMLAALALGLALPVAGCAQDNQEIIKKLDKISQQLEDLSKRGVGAGAPQRPQRPQPDPGKTYAVPVDDAPAIGRPDALVTIVKAYEYACPFCEKVRPTIDQIEKEYGDNVRVVYEPFVVHPQMATVPAKAACAAYRQGRFAQMNELLWEKVFKTRQFDENHVKELASEAGLDMNKYANDFKECDGWVQKHMSVLSRLGVGATPGFFINGRFLSGAQPFPAFKNLIDEELKKAEQRVAQGTPRASYYKTWVLEKGQPKL